MSLKQTIKGQDITARYGGEEFAVVLPNTALRQALAVADHIRRAVMAKELKKKSTGEILGRVTVSIGVSILRRGDAPDLLIERADACLYTAKRNGRNRVICETDPEYFRWHRSQRGPTPSSLAKNAGSRLSAGDPKSQPSILAGVSCTDSPHPQAETWFGLLKMNWACIFSAL